MPFWIPPVRRSLARAQQLPDGDWAAYGRDPGGERFSPLGDVRRENVAALEVAWTFARAMPTARKRAGRRRTRRHRCTSMTRSS